MTPYDMIAAARVAPGLPALTHAVVRLWSANGPERGWQLGGMTADLVSASALADCMAALYPPTPHRIPHDVPTLLFTPGPWEVAEIRDNPMGGERALSVHTGTARELVSPRELDMLNEVLVECRELLGRLVPELTAHDLDAIKADASELVDRLDDLYPDEAERTVTMDRAERRAFTPSEPESMPD